MIDLEPAGGKRATAAAPVAFGPKQVAAVMAALLLAVLVGGNLAGHSTTDWPRHRLAFDEPTPAATDPAATAGAGQSAAGVGVAVPTRPPADIPDGWTWRPVGPLSSRQGNIAVWPTPRRSTGLATVRADRRKARPTTRGLTVGAA